MVLSQGFKNVLYNLYQSIRTVHIVPEVKSVPLKVMVLLKWFITKYPLF